MFSTPRVFFPFRGPPQLFSCIIFVLLFIACGSFVESAQTTTTSLQSTPESFFQFFEWYQVPVLIGCGSVVFLCVMCICCLGCLLCALAVCLAMLKLFSVTRRRSSPQRLRIASTLPTEKHISSFAKLESHVSFTPVTPVHDSRPPSPLFTHQECEPSLGRDHSIKDQPLSRPREALSQEEQKVSPVVQESVIVTQALPRSTAISTKPITIEPTLLTPSHSSSQRNKSEVSLHSMRTSSTRPPSQSEEPSIMELQPVLLKMISSRSRRSRSKKSKKSKKRKSTTHSTHRKWTRRKVEILQFLSLEDDHLGGGLMRFASDPLLPQSIMQNGGQNHSGDTAASLSASADNAAVQNHENEQSGDVQSTTHTLSENQENLNAASSVKTALSVRPESMPSILAPSLIADSETRAPSSASSEGDLLAEDILSSIDAIDEDDDDLSSLSTVTDNQSIESLYPFAEEPHIVVSRSKDKIRDEWDDVDDEGSARTSETQLGSGDHESMMSRSKLSGFSPSVVYSSSIRDAKSDISVAAMMNGRRKVHKGAKVNGGVALCLPVRPIAANMDMRQFRKDLQGIVGSRGPKALRQMFGLQDDCLFMQIVLHTLRSEMGRSRNVRNIRVLSVKEAIGSAEYLIYLLETFRKVYP